MSYHQTTTLTNDQLKQAVISATKLEAAVLLIYKETRRKWTPWDIYGMMVRANKRNNKGFVYPITSVRRAITDLMNSKDLIKTGEMKPGELGRPETFYVINHTKHPTPSTAKQVGLWG